jgi:hypothetical protein
MSEQTIQESMQDTIQDIAAFSRDMVVINDWTVLDESAEHGPRFIIENADEVTSRRDVTTPGERWHIPGTLIEPFEDWSTTLNNFRDRRQSIMDAFNAVGTARSASGATGTNVEVIRNQDPIGYVFETYTDPDQEPEALPIFIQQRLIFEVVLF